MRIAYLGVKGLPSKGGTERVLEALVNRLASRHEITVYCDSRYTPADTRIPNVTLIRIPTPRGKHIRALLLFVLSSLHALIFGNYDLVHLHGVEACFTVPLLKLRYKVVATAHGSPTRSTRAKWGQVARFLMGLSEYPYLFLPDSVTTVSQVDALYCQQRYGRRPIYIPNGVDETPEVEANDISSVLEEIGVKTEKYILFAAGRIDPTKGCHLAIEAFNSISSDLPLIVIGDLTHARDYARELRNVAGERVKFVPSIASKARLLSLVRNCRVFLFPSLTEGMSMMLLEAASVGAAMICSAIPENGAVLGDRAVYFLSGNVADLAKKLSWALDHPAAMKAYARQAQAWVKCNYPWERIADLYDSQYKHLDGTHSPPSSVSV